MTGDSSRMLACGRTLEELSEYLASARTPADPAIEGCPECLNALEGLARVSQLSQDLLAHDADALPPEPEGWIAGIMSSIHDEVRAGRALPLSHPDPRVALTITEGAVRALIRKVGDEVPGVIVGRCRIDGDVERPGAPVAVTVMGSVAWPLDVPNAVAELRRRVGDALAEHTDLEVEAIHIRIDDLHGHSTHGRHLERQESP